MAEATPSHRLEWVEEDDDFSPFARHEADGGRSRSRVVIVALVVLLIAAIVAGVWFFAPAELRQRLGIAAADETPLQLMMTHSDRTQLASGNEFLNISGRIINPTDQQQKVPPIHAQLHDGSGQGRLQVDHPAADEGDPSGRKRQLQQRRAQHPAGRARADRHPRRAEDLASSRIRSAMPSALRRRARGSSSCARCSRRSGPGTAGEFPRRERSERWPGPAASPRPAGRDCGRIDDHCGDEKRQHCALLNALWGNGKQRLKHSSRDGTKRRRCAGLNDLLEARAYRDCGRRPLPHLHDVRSWRNW